MSLNLSQRATSAFRHWTPVPCLHGLPLSPGSANGLRYLFEYNFELWLFLLETADYLIQVGYDHRLGTEPP